MFVVARSVFKGCKFGVNVNVYSVLCIGLFNAVLARLAF